MLLSIHLFLHPLLYTSKLYSPNNGRSTPRYFKIVQAANRHLPKDPPAWTGKPSHTCFVFKVYCEGRPTYLPCKVCRGIQLPRGIQTDKPIGNTYLFMILLYQFTVLSSIIWYFIGKACKRPLPDWNEDWLVGWWFSSIPFSLPSCCGLFFYRLVFDIE